MERGRKPSCPKRKEAHTRPHKHHHHKAIASLLPQATKPGESAMPHHHHRRHGHAAAAAEAEEEAPSPRPSSAGCYTFLRSASRRGGAGGGGGYRRLDSSSAAGDVIRVEVGTTKGERSVFHVDQAVLEAGPVRRLLAAAGRRTRGGAVAVAVDVLLFEHLLWLQAAGDKGMLGYDDDESAAADLSEIVDFYSQDDDVDDSGHRGF
uniref:Uncharacterized protein n=5 Tax=Oryza TaxID=4527 RepID=Q8LI23_ORYSJ|nr:hypothetical protein [Oryza sativa Japonica Group]BAC22344.1 hypothetical protein [Oryza sativa Japonica Group]